MEVVDLADLRREHDFKVGQEAFDLEANCTEDTLFVEDGKHVGFFIRDIKEWNKKAYKLGMLANHEFNSNRVPKSNMRRSSGLTDLDNEVVQYSTILGSCAPKPHMKRPYPTISSVHENKNAHNFIKAMILLGREAMDIIKQVSTPLYNQQLRAISKVPEEWRFADYFTSSISNYNISANYHQDHANIKGSLNVIICKRENSKGGCTTVPDYDVTFDSVDSSMLVYPAWRNLHAVTPIRPQKKNGYRNTLVFYSLKAFIDDDHISREND